MSDPVHLRATAVIGATAISVVLAATLWVSSGSTAPGGSCQLSYEERLYCSQTLSISEWCPAGVPCPNFWQTTALLGYTFHVMGAIDRNGTPKLDVSIQGPNATDYGFALTSNPFGTPVDWSSPDGLALVIWPSPVPAAEPDGPGATNVICGVAAPP